MVNTWLVDIKSHHKLLFVLFRKIDKFIGLDKDEILHENQGSSIKGL